MHEAGVAARLLEVVLARAAEAGESRVTVVDLEAGPDRGPMLEALRFHWREAARGTPAEDAELRVTPVDEADAFRLVAIET